VSSTVLIAAGDVQVRAALGEWLEAAGYKCLPAGPADALALTQSRRPHAAIVGVNAMDDGGMWIVRQLRARPIPIGVIAVTDPPSLEVAAALSRIGVVDCLPGLPTRDEIVDAVRRALLWRRAVIGAHTGSRRLDRQLASGRRRLARAAGASGPAEAEAGLLHLLEERAPHMAAHSHRVAGIATDLGRALALSHAALDKLQVAARLHDVGIAAMPDRLLRGRPLGDHEVAVLKTHGTIARDTLAAVPGMEDVASIVGAIGARFDGSDAPKAPAGTQIPIAARIVAVANAYDALVSGPLCDAPMTADDANAALVSQAGSRLDPRVVRTWLALEDAGR
jgi:response regulator RpfG family c-di-GMP phosphodiesterase